MCAKILLPFLIKRGTQTHSVFVNALKFSEMIMSLGNLFCVTEY